MWASLAIIFELILYCGFIIGMVFCGFIILLFAFCLPFFILALILSGIIALYEKIRFWYLGYKYRKELEYKDEHDIEDK